MTGATSRPEVGAVRRSLPNLLTIARIGLAVALIPASAAQVPFVAVLLAAGATDVADGYLARRWRVQSPFGAALDSVSDAVFILTAIGVLWWRGSLWQDDPAAWPIAAVVGGSIILLRMVNLAIVRIRFGRWGGLHTVANKVAGLVFFATVVAVAAVPDVSVAVLGPLALVSAAAAIEETVILMTSASYDADRTGLFRYGRQP